MGRGILHAEVRIVRLGPRSFLLIDGARGVRFRCGREERWLVERLARPEPPGGLPEAFRREFGRPLPKGELRSFRIQLERLGLTAPPDPADRVRAWDPPSPPEPLSAADPAGALNHRFDWLVVVLGWMLHPVWILPLLGMAWIAVSGCLRNVDLLMLQLASLFRESLATTLVLLVLTRALVTLPREILMGMACRKYGGRIQAFGLHWWYRILPFFLCRISDPGASERGRWTLITIGLWVYLAVFAGSILAWTAAPDPGLLSDVLALAALIGGLGFLFRLNPFEHTPAYGALCYRFNVQDLSSRALAETRAWLSFRSSPEPLTLDERFWFRWYGLGVYATRALIVFLLGLLLWVRFGGVGMIVLAALVLVWRHESSRQAAPRRRDQSRRPAESPAAVHPA